MKHPLVLLVSCVALAALLAACAPVVRASNENTVVVSNANPGNALETATTECAKYGRTAQLVRYDENAGFIFNCVP